LPIGLRQVVDNAFLATFGFGAFSPAQWARTSAFYAKLWVNKQLDMPVKETASR
jgi:hypothetical protein